MRTLIIIILMNFIVTGCEKGYQVADEAKGYSIIEGSQDNTLGVFIQTGQSNALGQPNSPVLGELPVEYQGVQSRIKIWWEGDYLTYDPESGTFENMECVVNTRHHDYTDPSNAYYDRVGWSTEQELAQSFLNNYTNMYILKSAYGGNSSGNWIKPTGARWVELERYVNKSIEYFSSRNLDPVFLGCFWLQGESDIHTSTAVYQQRLEDFIANLRALSPYLSDLPFFLCEIPTDYYGDPISVNQSFHNISILDDNVYFITTLPHAAEYPLGHYTPQGLLDLGADLYVKVTELLPVFLTWYQRDSDLVIEDNGLRKTAHTSFGDVARSNQKVKSGQFFQLVPKEISAGYSKQILIGFIDLLSMSTWTEINFGLYFYETASEERSLYKIENGSATNLSHVWSEDNLYRVNYGASITYEYSTDNGDNWIVLNTSSISPTGCYYIGVDMYNESKFINAQILE